MSKTDKTPVVVLDGDNQYQIHKKFEHRYEAIVCFTEQEVIDHCQSPKIQLVVLDQSYDAVDSYALLRELKADEKLKQLPVIVMSDQISTDDKIKALELGASDFILHDVLPKEMELRFDRVIIDHIASEQLKDQIRMAQQVAMRAMTGSSNLGTNIQFFIDSANCTSLDELGLTLYQTLNAYQVNCSLQMRSRFGIKNMESNGLAKELESQLLTELKNEGRYVDFGQRSVMNFERVSILVKNMPKDDPERYGELKDYVFSLLQGVDARIIALDNRMQLELERDLVRLLVSKVQSAMTEIEEGFQLALKDFATIFEDLSQNVDEVIVAMDMREDQEKALEAIVQTSMAKTNEVFSTGLKLDSGFNHLVSEMKEVLSGSGEQMSPRRLATLIQKLSE